MAGRLVQVATNTVTSATALIDFGGTITTDCPYLLIASGVVPQTDAHDYKLRFTESGSPISTTVYHYGLKRIRTDTTFNNTLELGASSLDLTSSIGNATGEQANSMLYIYNAYNSNVYTHFTMSEVQQSNSALLIGYQGGGQFARASQVDGLEIFCQSGSDNLASGTFTLFKVL